MDRANELAKFMEDLDAPGAVERFQDLVDQGIYLTCIDDLEVAVEFGCSRTMVRMWRLGTGAPHPLIREHVFNWFRSRARKLLEEDAK